MFREDRTSFNPDLFGVRLFYPSTICNLKKKKKREQWLVKLVLQNLIWPLKEVNFILYDIDIDISDMWLYICWMGFKLNFWFSFCLGSDGKEWGWWERGKWRKKIQYVSRLWCHIHETCIFEATHAKSFNWGFFFLRGFTFFLLVMI